jgi:hypothetical protein
MTTLRDTNLRTSRRVILSVLVALPVLIALPVLFMTSLGAFTVSLIDFAREVRIAVSELDCHA